MKDNVENHNQNQDQDQNELRDQLVDVYKKADKLSLRLKEEHEGLDAKELVVETLYWSPADSNGLKSHLRAVIACRAQRPLKPKQEPQYYYMGVTTREAYLRDREGNWGLYEAGQVVLIDEKYNLKRMRALLPRSLGDGTFEYYEASILVIACRKMKSSKNSIWEFSIKAVPFQPTSSDDEELEAMAMTLTDV